MEILLIYSLSIISQHWKLTAYIYSVWLDLVLMICPVFGDKNSILANLQFPVL